MAQKISLDLSKLLPAGIWTDIILTKNSLVFSDQLYLLSSDFLFTILDIFRAKDPYTMLSPKIKTVPGLIEYYVKDFENGDFYELVADAYQQYLKNFNKFRYIEELGEDWIEQAIIILKQLDIAEIYHGYLENAFDNIFDNIDTITPQKLCENLEKGYSQIMTGRYADSNEYLWLTVIEEELAKLSYIFYDEFDPDQYMFIQENISLAYYYIKQKIFAFAKTKQGLQIKKELLSEAITRCTKL